LLQSLSLLSSSSSGPVVARLPSLAATDALRSAWNAMAGDNPFRRWEWAESWWNAYGHETSALGQRRELLVLIVVDAGNVIGVAPWQIERSAARGSVIHPLGAGEVCSEYPGVLARSGREDCVAIALAETFTERRLADRATGTPCVNWDLLELQNTRHDDLATNRFAEQLAERGGSIHSSRGVSCWRIDLPADWNAYLACLSRSHRKQLLRLERRYFDTGRARLCTAIDEASLDRGLTILMDLHQRRWESLGAAGCFSSQPFAAFIAAVARREAQSGVLDLNWLELDGRPIAAEIHLRIDSTVYAYQSGIEPSALIHEPGRLITLALLKRAIANGCRRFDFLRGDEPYKAHFRAEPIATRDLRIVPATGTARLRHGLWVAGGSVKDWLKSGFVMPTWPAVSPATTC
jgi:CelD/BcsL family acetyltransferase involved in cellulose biosynthesis